MNVPVNDLNLRLEKFRENLTSLDDSWEYSAIFGKINTYYFTGTMQNGVLIIPREEEAVYFVRKSFDRAKIESEFKNIVKINSFKEIKEYLTINSNSIHIEKEVLPFAVFERFNKYFGFNEIKSLDLAIAKSRAVKSEFELDLMKKAGEIHSEVLEKIVPSLLRVGMSEAELGALILNEKIKRGHHGITRMGSFNAELYLGNICFGENGNYYNSFDGPGGLKGVCPAVPLLGSFDRKLKKDDILYVDTATGYFGYHTDKTSVYSMSKVSDKINDMHKKCVDIQNRVAEMLIPGAIPSEIYKKITKDLDENFEKNFMGFESNKVKFLAHGIGLVVDEYPVVANGFDEPIEKNMVFAIEPKNFIKDIGLVGVENTFVVQEKGAKSITGCLFNIIEI